MTRKLKTLTATALMSLAIVALAACGGDTNTEEATVGVSTTGIGDVLVDSQGRTLYLFERDTTTASTCTGECATDWPPLLADGKPTAGSGADAALVATTKRPGGGSQVTYNGHPLYRYAGDAEPGDTAGQGVVGHGAAWYALSASGDEVTAKPASSDEGSGNSGGGYGY